LGREMAELFFDKLMGMLGVDTTPQEDQRDPLDTSDPQFGYRDYTPAERAQEVLYGSLDTAGSMLRGVAKAGIEAPRDIYALGSAIGKIQDRSRNRVEGEPVKTIGELFMEAYNEAPSFLPDEEYAERKLYDFTPMSRTYSQDASVYNLPEEFGRIAAPLPLLDYARPSQIARIGKVPRILEDGLLTDEAVGALGRIPAGMSVKPVDDAGAFKNFTEDAVSRLETNPMSREVVVEMPIQDYLKFAREANPEAPENIEKAAGVKGVEKFDDIPFLSIEVKDGVAKVDGHEGRHRAKELLARGETTMPVRIRSSNIRWGQQNKPDSYDYKQDFPTQLVGEEGSVALREGSTMPFPVQRGDYGIVRKEQPTPRILDARDPITQNTDWRVPALEPLREPTRHGRYQVVGGDDSKRQMLFNDEILNQTDEQIIEKLKTYPDWDIVWSNARNKVKENMGLNPYGYETANQQYNIDILTNQEIARNQRSFQQQSIIKPTQERMSFMGQRPSYTAEEGRQILLDDAQRRYQYWKTTGQEMRDRGQRQVATFDLPKLIDRINNASDEQIFATIKAEGLEPKQSPTPRILQEDVPQVEKLPPMLREPAQQARVFGESDTYSRLEQALLDIKNDPKAPASMTPRDLNQRLGAKGVTKAELEESGINMTELQYKNKNGNYVVNVEDVFQQAEPPSGNIEVMRTSYADSPQAQRLPLSDEIAPMDVDEFFGYDLSGEVGEIRGEAAYDIGNLAYDRWGEPADNARQILKNQFIEDGMTPNEADSLAVERIELAVEKEGDNWVDWLADPDQNNGEYNYALEEAIDDAFDNIVRERYGENPYYRDTITYADGDFDIMGNFDDGFTVTNPNGEIIASNESFDEAMVQIREWASDYSDSGGDTLWHEYGLLNADPEDIKYKETQVKAQDVPFDFRKHDMENAIGFLRHSERSTEDHGLVTYVDEMQSDVHQTGREYGYDTSASRSERMEKSDRLNEAYSDAKTEYLETAYEDRIPNPAGLKQQYSDEQLKQTADRIDAILRNMDDKLLDRYYRREAEEIINEPEAAMKIDLARALFQRAADYGGAFKQKSLKKVANAVASGLKNDPIMGKAFGDKYKKMLGAKEDYYRHGEQVSADFPLKDERWIRSMVYQALKEAQLNNTSGVAFTNKAERIAAWSEDYAELYQKTYEEKLPSILKSIGEEYGVKPIKIDMSDDTLSEYGQRWFLPLTPEMKKTIKSRGVPLASAVGTTPMILDRINKEREDKTPRILRTA